MKLILEIKYSKQVDYFVYTYYMNHKEDFNNPIMGVTEEMIKRLVVRPTLNMYIPGPIQYFSKKSCNIMVEHMKKINYNIEYQYEDYGYPYILQDVGTTFILKDIEMTSYPLYSDSLNLEYPTVIGIHTNDFKQNF